VKGRAVTSNDAPGDLAKNPELPTEQVGGATAVSPAPAPASRRKAPATASTMDELIFLSGRPPLNEFLGFIATQYTDPQSLNLRSLSDEWRAANKRVQQLEAAEAGWADNPTIAPTDASLNSLRDQVLNDPLFQRSSPFVPVELGVVELDRLVVHQKHINLSYVRGLEATLGDNPNPGQIFRFCLPVGHPNTPLKAMRIAQNSYVFVSPSNDFRFLDSAVLTRDQLKDFSSPGQIANVVGLVVGFSANYFMAIHVDNRLILHNGSHRAFALRELGVTHAPCAIMKVTHPEELTVTAPENVHQNRERYLTAPRPPVLKDYFDPQLRKVLEIPRKLRQVKISFGVEAIDVPA
jgi:hypothetical protein